jgi:hypothetical protein
MPTFAIGIAGGHRFPFLTLFINKKTKENGNKRKSV